MSKWVQDKLILLALFLIISLAWLTVPDVQAQPINWQLEAVQTEVDEKQKAKNLLVFLTKLGASASVIQEKLSPFDQQKVAEAISELKVEGKIRDKAGIVTK